MLKLLLMSVVIVPVLLGMQAATTRGERRGVLVLLALVLTYAILYMLMLYYVRFRWVG